MGAASAAQRHAGLSNTYQPYSPNMNKPAGGVQSPAKHLPAGPMPTGPVPIGYQPPTPGYQGMPAQNGIQALNAPAGQGGAMAYNAGQSPQEIQNYWTQQRMAQANAAPMAGPSYSGMPAQNGIQPLGAQSSGPYQQPYPQPAQYLPFGSGTTIGPTAQHPDMRNFNFMAPGGQQQAPQQQAPQQQAPQQTGLSRVLDQFLGNTQSGRPQVRMFGGMGVPGLGAGSLGAIDRAVQSGALPRDYRVPFRNQVGVGFGTPTFNQ